MGYINDFPYTDFHELNLDWFLNKFKTLYNEWINIKKDFNSVKDELNDLKIYIENYFRNLNVYDEISKKLDEMFENGTLESIFYDYTKIVDYANSEPFAHVIPPDSRSAQGMCCYVHNGVPYIACGFLNYVEIHNIENGELVKKIESDLFNHCNDITYYNSFLYIADTVNNYLITLNLDDYTISKTIELSQSFLHGIDYNSGVFYVLTLSPEIVTLFTSDFKKITSYNVNYPNNINAKQGIYVDANYLYLVSSRAIRDDNKEYYNVLSCYNKFNGKFIKNIYLPYGMELEGVSFYNNSHYFYYNCYSLSGFVAKGSLYFNNNPYIPFVGYANMGFGRFNTSTEIHLNELESNFLIDGSNEKPFKYWEEANAVMTNLNTPYYHLMIDSDITRKIVIHPTMFNVIGIYGQNKNKISVDCRLLNYIHFSNIMIELESNISKCANVYFEKCNIKNVTIEDCSSLRLDSTNLYTKNRFYSINNVWLTGDYEADANSIDSNRLVGLIRYTTMPSNMTNDFKLPSTVFPFDNFGVSNDAINKLRTTTPIGVLRCPILSPTTNLDLFSLKCNCNLLLESGSGFINKPDERGSILTVKTIGTVRVFYYANTNNTSIYTACVTDSTNTGWIELHA